MVRLLLLAGLILCFTRLGAQGLPGTNDIINLVPNPGFEEYSAYPLGWYYKGEHFSRVMRFWTSPTAASPDAFGPRVRVPAHWADKDFGKQPPRTGESMAGITLYGCEEGKPHCREFLQVQLIESLVVGQHYYVEFWVSPLPRSLRINNLGAHFSIDKVEAKTDKPLNLPPQVNASGVVKAKAGKWVRVSGHFVAKKPGDYLIIGNFFPDSTTSAQAVTEAPLKFAYYYIDDVLVRKEEPILPVPVPPDDLTRIEMKEGKVIQLKNIFFETDKAELLPRSYVELNKLTSILRQYPAMVIQVQGHTDSRGEDDYNLDLSERRAKAVIDYLHQQGISPERTLFRGFGSSQPVASNQTEEGRQLNRRVEFIILKM